MLMKKWIKGLLLAILLGISIYWGRFVYDLTYDILQFQVGWYKLLLQTQQWLSSVQDTIWWAGTEILEMFGLVEESTISKIWSNDRGMDEKLDMFRKKLKKLALIIGVIVGALILYLWRKIIFWLRTFFREFNEFRRE